jgi:hypothetical protein
MSSVHSQRTGSDSGARAQPTNTDETPRPEPGDMSQEGTGRGSENTMTGDDVTRVDEMPIEVRQEVYVLPTATHRMARVVQQEFPIYQGESPLTIERQDFSTEGPMPEMARVVSRRRRSRSRSRIRGQPNMARVSSRSRSGSRSRSRSSQGGNEMGARVISGSRRNRSRSGSKSRGRQRGKRHCIKLRTRRRGMGRMARDVDGVTAPGSGEKGPWSELFGYREYSSLLATDSDFLVFKRFGASNARVLLALQDDVMRKERDLAEFENSLRQSTGPEKEKIHVARLDYQADNAVWKLHESLDRYSLFFLCG